MASAAKGFSMPHSAFWLDARDATRLHVNHWASNRPPRGLLMLAHGMAEHGARYARLGEALGAAGFELYAIDLRGHGRSAENGVLGHFADADGWQKVIDDLACLNHHIRQQHPSAPILFLGHSMGSYIGQAYLMQHSSSLQGAVLCGSNYQPALLFRAARLLARFERWRLGPSGRSRLLNRLSFGAFNKAFEPARSAFDWLSRDQQEVDRYLADNLCGFICTTQLWVDLLGGLESISTLDNLAQIDPRLPILVIGGECDPVSQGRRLTDLAGALRHAGVQEVELKIYPGARHELFNESNRDEVTRDLVAWLEKSLGHTRYPPSHCKEPA
jgi:alpha-beta hydrolase superfamily lysophospholipase